jgi:hypothetical protein
LTIHAIITVAANGAKEIGQIKIMKKGAWQKKRYAISHNIFRRLRRLIIFMEINCERMA